jgi:hypothetical protein
VRRRRKVAALADEEAARTRAAQRQQQEEEDLNKEVEEELCNPAAKPALPALWEACIPTNCPNATAAHLCAAAAGNPTGTRVR